MFRDFLTVAMGYLMAGVILFAGWMVITAPEDSPWFNCYLSGNMYCGQTAEWHGFINLGRADD